MKARIRFWIARRKKRKEIESKVRLNIGEIMKQGTMRLTID